MKVRNVRGMKSFCGRATGERMKQMQKDMRQDTWSRAGVLVDAAVTNYVCHGRRLIRP